MKIDAKCFKQEIDKCLEDGIYSLDVDINGLLHEVCIDSKSIIGITFQEVDQKLDSIVEYLLKFKSDDTQDINEIISAKFPDCHELMKIIDMLEL